MLADDPNTPPTPDPTNAHLDPGTLKDAHSKTGRMLKSAGLPFEIDEFGAEDDDSTSGSSGEGSPPPATP